MKQHKNSRARIGNCESTGEIIKEIQGKTVLVTAMTGRGCIAPGKDSQRLKRKTGGWDDDYRHRTVRMKGALSQDTVCLMVCKW